MAKRTMIIMCFVGTIVIITVMIFSVLRLSSGSIHDPTTSTSESQYNESYHRASLYVNGVFITDTNVFFVNRDNELSHATIPFVPVLEALGFSVEWTDEYTAMVSKDSRLYTLSLTDKTLIENNQSHDSNLIITAPGCDHGYVQAVEKDLIMNYENVSSTLQLMGITVRKVLDCDNVAVCIDVIKER